LIFFLQVYQKGLIIGLTGYFSNLQRRDISGNSVFPNMACAGKIIFDMVVRHRMIKSGEEILSMPHPPASGTGGPSYQNVNTGSAGYIYKGGG
jgi:hypothetical protein